MTQELRDAAQAVRARSNVLHARSEVLMWEAKVSMARGSAASAVDAAKSAALMKEVENLRIALESRAAIEQAKGIVIAALACSADEAFHVLVQQSQHENRKLREVANDLVRSKQRRRN